MKHNVGSRRSLLFPCYLIYNFIFLNGRILSQMPSWKHPFPTISRSSTHKHNSNRSRTFSHNYFLWVHRCLSSVLFLSSIDNENPEVYLRLLMITWSIILSVSSNIINVSLLHNGKNGWGEGNVKQSERKHFRRKSR